MIAHTFLKGGRSTAICQHFFEKLCFGDAQIDNVVTSRTALDRRGVSFRSKSGANCRTPSIQRQKRRPIPWSTKLRFRKDIVRASFPQLRAERERAQDSASSLGARRLFWNF
jgi:hypothetical protein